MAFQMFLVMLYSISLGLLVNSDFSWFQGGWPPGAGRNPWMANTGFQGPPNGPMQNFQSPNRPQFRTTYKNRTTFSHQWGSNQQTIEVQPPINEIRPIAEIGPPESYSPEQPTKQQETDKQSDEPIIKPGNSEQEQRQQQIQMQEQEPTLEQEPSQEQEPRLEQEPRQEQESSPYQESNMEQEPRQEQEPRLEQEPIQKQEQEQTITPSTDVWSGNQTRDSVVNQGYSKNKGFTVSNNQQSGDSQLEKKNWSYDNTVESVPQTADITES